MEETTEASRAYLFGMKLPQSGQLLSGLGGVLEQPAPTPIPGPCIYAATPVIMLCSMAELTWKQGDLISGLDLIIWTLQMMRKPEEWEV